MPYHCTSQRIINTNAGAKSITIEFHLRRIHSGVGGDPYVEISQQNVLRHKKKFLESAEKNCYIARAEIDIENVAFTYTLHLERDGRKENLYYGDLKANRSFWLSNEQMKIGHVVLYDVVGATDGHHEKWLDLVLAEMQMLLPGLLEHGEIKSTCKAESPQISIWDELYYWVQQTVNGWTILKNDGVAETFLPSSNQKALNDALVFWMNNINGNTLEQERVKENIIATVIFLGLVKNHHTLEDCETMVLICNSLSIHELDDYHQECLLRELLLGYETVKFSFPPMLEIFDMLFHGANCTPIPEVILLLPLYWVVKRKKVCITFPKTDCVSSEQPELPAITGCTWLDYWKRLNDDIAQNTFAELHEKVWKIYRFHHWITQPYLHFLRGKNVISLLLQNPQAQKCFPIGHVLAKLFKCATNITSGMGVSDIRKLESYITGEMQALATNVKNNTFDGNHGHTAVQMVKAVSTYLQESEGEVLVWSNVNWCVDLANKAANCLLEKDPSEILELKTMLGTITKKIVAPPHHANSPLKDWDQLLSYEWGNQDISEGWKNGIIKACRKKLDEKWKGKEERYLEAYVRSPKDLTASVKTVLCEKCTDCVKHVLNKPEAKWIQNKLDMIQHIASANYRPLISILEDIISADLQMARLPDHNEAEQALEFILTWSPSAPFYNKFGYLVIDQKSSIDGAPNIYKVTKAFNDAIEQLISGSITLRCLGLLLTRAEVARQMNSAIRGVNKTKQVKKKTSAGYSDEEFTGILETRRQEMNRIYELRSEMKEFQLLCQIGEIPVDFGSLGSKLLTDISNELLTNLEQEAEKITERDSGGLEGVLSWKDNEIFKHLWIKTMAKWKKKRKTTACDWRIALRQISRTAVSELSAYSKLINDGRIYLWKLRQWHDRNPDPFKVALCEVCKLTDPSGNAGKAVLKSFDGFMEVIKSADTLGFVLQASRLFTLEVDVSVYCKMQNMQKKRGGYKLMDVGEDVSAVRCFPDSIKNISQELNAFMKRRKFLKWLHQKIDDEDEINSMCDLALTHNDEMITEKVNCFSNAVHGFAPLIFGIFGEHLTIEDLGDKCMAVQENLKNNPYLLEEWADSADNLPIFEEIELHLGSVEKSFLQIADEINAKGIYEVIATSNKQLSVENIVKVYIPFADEDPTKLIAETGLRSATFDKKETYRFGKLHEIQSVLMLITNSDEKARQTVSRFNELFAPVGKLAGALIALVQTGCMLFCNFYVNIIPISGSEVIIKVSFGNGIKPFGERCQLQDVRKLSFILEESQERWADYIKNKRMEHYYLNEYSISQITYLCQHLAISRYTADLPDQVIALLSAIRYGPWSELNHLLDEATSALDQPQDIILSPADPAHPDHGCDSKKQAVRRLMMECDDISEDAAKAAVQAEEEEDVRASWFLLHQYDEELILKYCEEFEREEAYSTEKPPTFHVPSLAQNSVQCELAELVEQLQQGVGGEDKPVNLLPSISAICRSFLNQATIITLRNYLSIEHLGRFLTKFRKATPHVHVVRSMIPPLERGKPNLLIFPEKSVLETVLQLYAHEPKQDLPTKSEVLVCSEKTTVDEVERFMRRAMMRSDNKGSPLFCLPFIEKLDFGVMKAMEKMYNTLKENKAIDEGYQLVLISCNQKNYLAGCFEKYQVSIIPNSRHLPDYIGEHLVVPEKAAKSSAHVDENKRMVKIVASGASGNGKSLYIARQKINLKKLGERPCTTTIRLLQKDIDHGAVVSKLLADINGLSFQDPYFIYIDIAPSVTKGIEEFVFCLLILGSIEDSTGKVWRRHENHYYMIEMTDPELLQNDMQFSEGLFGMLPHTITLPPSDVLVEKYQDSPTYFSINVDELFSPTFQRPYQYLERLNKEELCNTFCYKRPDGLPEDCVKVLLQNCPISKPSWSQLKNFASFLNVQLRNCEMSTFLDQKTTGPHLEGLKEFATKFMIRMSQDFGIQSLDISDQSSAKPQRAASSEESNFPEHRKWEGSLHPYMFFNDDRHTMTFINVNLTDEGDLIDYEGNILEKEIIKPLLVSQLRQQGVIFGKKLDVHTRLEKLQHLCNIMGIKECFDPDETYGLTADNVQKIIAMYMRFRCQVPVVIMGETGCGKTRMVEFMSKLLARKSPGCVKNMVVQKIYGGITASEIYDSVKKAQAMARMNQEKSKSCGTDICDVSAILFLDEANTTEAIHAVKEVMCDSTIDGVPVEAVGLRIIAACNPYKKLTGEAIKRLENSGLGSKIHAGEADQKKGDTMRSLLYKVNPLPPSMQPYVWDFGQLDDNTESLYIEQMAGTLKRKTEMDLGTLCSVIARAQAHVRHSTDKGKECRFVSLRDAERCMRVFEWLIQHRDPLFEMIDEERVKSYPSTKDTPLITNEIRAILQMVGICYHASLEDRESFRKSLCSVLQKFGTNLTERDIHQELIAAQSAFLRGIKIDEDISCNEALRENFFMMAVCADLRIPLFLIGKPGSSKSLAKTVISSNMQGKLSHSKLFKTFKQIRLISYQCSALSDAAGIKQVFEQGARLQKKQDLDAFASVIVLDEIGLAEDSPSMPLKILHPLLESGSTESESLTDYDPSNKVGFIGISNWALDPAKLNRGVFVLRSIPEKNDLLETAKSICSHQHQVSGKGAKIEPLLAALTEAYSEVYKSQKVEYFGLRDYYNLIKMAGMAKNTFEVSLAILRNFSGAKISVLDKFKEKVCHVFPNALQTVPAVKDIVQRNLRETDTRFLLLLTAQSPSLSFLPKLIEDFQNKVEVVYGSSFPGDHGYIEICRNINRIKVCMEAGKTVILLNMTDVHESLYDALNQHFITLGGKRYIDLGLGGHRVKCCISPDFRLIVIEKKDTAHYEYPIPLLNRLEKHNLDAKGLLQDEDNNKVKSLEEWVKSFGTDKHAGRDTFVGFHDDTIPSVILFCHGDFEKSKRILLQSACMDVIFRRLSGQPSADSENMLDTYLLKQRHDNLINLLASTVEELLAHESRNNLIVKFDILTYSGILTKADRIAYETLLGLPKHCMMVINLEQFQTQKECEDRIDIFLKTCQTFENAGSAQRGVAILMVQCSQAQCHGDLIECVKHIWANKAGSLDSNVLKIPVIVIFLWSVERPGKYTHTGKDERFVVQQSQDYHVVYVDDLKPPEPGSIPTVELLQKELSEILMTRQSTYLKSLVTACIFEAVRKVKSSKDDWYFGRLKILKHLCTHEDETSAGFCEILMNKIICMVKEVEQVEKWVELVVNSQETLQDGGTFRKALLLSLKHRISHCFAYIISAIDATRNLDIIANADESSESWKASLWIKMFGIWEVEPLGFSCAQEFLIINPGPCDTPKPCQLPFSFSIMKIMGELWEKLTSEGMAETNIQERFVMAIRDKAMIRILAETMDNSGTEQPMSAFASDLVSSFHSPLSDCEDAEMEVVRMILLELALHECEKLKQKSSHQKGDEVSLIYSTFKRLSKYLERLSEIFRVCPELVRDKGKVDGWVARQLRSSTINIHVSALKDALDFLCQKVENIKDPEPCLEWMKEATRIKQIIHPMLDFSEDQSHKNDIIKSWMPLSLLDLLLHQLIPNENEEKLQFAAVIGPSAKLMLKGSSKADLQSEDFVKIVCNVLRKCYENIRLNMLMSWGSTICRHCRKKMQDPLRLECGHPICPRCYKSLITEQMRVCPFCRNSITNNPMPLTLSGKDDCKLDSFKSSCTSFFLEFLKSVCFSEVLQANLPSRSNRPISLIFTLIVGAKKTAKKCLDTQALNLDLNAKSIILNELMKESSEEVQIEVNDCLQQLEAEELRGLVETVIYCCEKRLFLGLPEKDRSVLDDGVINSEEKQLQKTSKGKQLKLTTDTLWTFANCRHILRRLAALIHASSGGSTDLADIEQLMKEAQSVTTCDDPNRLKKFLLQAGYHEFGKNWYKRMRDQKLHYLIPPNLLQSKYKPDFWLLLGEKYRDTMNRLHRNSEELQNLINQCLQATPFSLETVLGVMKWANSKDTGSQQHIHMQIQKSQNPGTRLLVSLKLSLSSYFDKLKNISEMEIQDEGAVKGLALLSAQDEGAVKGLVLLNASILHESHPMMGCFSSIALHPSTVSHMSLRDIFKEKADGQVMEWTTMVIRIILNMCVITAMKTDRNAVAKMLGESRDGKTMVSTLIQSLLEDIRDLSGMLGKDIDDVVLILHKILCHISEDRANDSDGSTSDWATDSGRNEWRMNFYKRYLKSIFDNLPIEIENARKIAESDLNEELHRMAHEADVAEEKSMLWMYTKHSSKVDFLRSLERSKAGGEVLGIIFQATNLHLVKYLEPTLKLQKALISKCQTQLLLDDAEKYPLSSYIEKDEENQKLGESYVSLWNQVCQCNDFQRRGKAKGIPKDWLTPMSVDSPVSMALPNSRGHGQCAKLLVEYLVMIQNQFLDECEEVGKFHRSNGDIEVSRLSHSHIICVDEKQDLLPLIHTHAKYERTVNERGRRHQTIYHIDVLEKQVEEKYVNYKRKIKENTMPCIRYLQDAGFGSDWRDVVANIPQRSLPDNMVKQVDNAASHSTVVYDGVRALTHAITYIAKGNVKPETKLLQFLQSDLSIPPPDIVAIPTTAIVEHTLALYLRLSWHRSVIFMTRGLDPYREALADVKQEKIEENKRLIVALSAAFRHMDITSFQLCINEIILKIPAFAPDLSLSKSILPNYEFVIEKTDVDKFYRIPESVCFKHISHLFELSIRYKNNFPPFGRESMIQARSRML